MSENGKILADPIIVEFVDSSGGEIIKADLLELMIGVYAASEGNDKESECIVSFRDWLKQTHNVIVTLTQAQVIYSRVWDRYQSFKKKLDDASRSPNTSESVLSESTIE